MLADAQTMEIGAQRPIGTSVHFGVHLGFSYSFQPVEVLGSLLQLGGGDGVMLRFLTIDSADEHRQMYAFTDEDALELTSKLAGAFPGYIERARKLLDDMEEAGVGN
jgi:hypothetical protein